MDKEINNRKDELTEKLYAGIASDRKDEQAVIDALKQRQVRDPWAVLEAVKKSFDRYLAEEE